jgi:hypothetical protein
VLHAWAQRLIAELMSRFGNALSACRDGAAVARAAEQVAYCGASLARVGLDMRPLAHAAVEAALLRVFAARMASAGAGIEGVVNRHCAGGSALAAIAAADQDKAAAEDKKGGGGDDDGGADDDADGAAAVATRRALAAPTSLLDHPPLAVWLNHFLSGANDLRAFAPLAIADRVAALTASELARLARAVAAKSCVPGNWS